MLLGAVGAHAWMRASALRYVLTPFVGCLLPAVAPNLPRTGLAAGVKIARRRGALLARASLFALLFGGSCDADGI